MIAAIFLARLFTVAELKAQGMIRGSSASLLTTLLSWAVLYHGRKYPVKHLACIKQYFLDCLRSLVCRILARAKTLQLYIMLTYDL